MLDCGRFVATGQSGANRQQSSMLFPIQGPWSAPAAWLCAFLRFLAARLHSELAQRQSPFNSGGRRSGSLRGDTALRPVCCPKPFEFYPSLEQSEEFITVFLYSGRRPSTWPRDALRARPPDDEAGGPRAQNLGGTNRFIVARCATSRWRTGGSWRW